MVTSSKARGRVRSLLSTVSDTSAMPSGLRFALPAKITSCVFVPRTALAFCSPSTQRTASAMLDLPEPLGPTIAVTPWEKAISVFSAKVLKPASWRRLRCTANIRLGRVRAILSEVRMVCQTGRSGSLMAGLPLLQDQNGREEQYRAGDAGPGQGNAGDV